MKVTVVGAGNVGATCADVLAQREIANEIVTDRIVNHTYNQLQNTKYNQYPFIKIELNNFIGSPR